MEPPTHFAAAPPDDGHRGAGTLPEEVLVPDAFRDPDPGPDNPFLHWNASWHARSRDVSYGMGLAAGLLVAFFLLMGIYIPM